MCLRPIYIGNKTSGKLQRLPAFEHGKYFLPSLSGFYVPCGKCVECLKNKQRAKIPQYYRELSKHDSSCFVTLTYRNDTLPLSLCVQDWIEKIDYETGEYSKECVSCTSHLLPSDLRSDLIDFFGLDMDKDVKSKVIDCPFGGSETWRLTPSLDRENVRLYVKKIRKQIQQQGLDFPSFKYVCVGEYGPRTSRPHFHLLVAGLTLSQCKYFFHRWKSEYGNICVRKIQDKIKSDGKYNDSKVAVSHYISKYMSKGCFECDCVKFGWVQSPRTMVSRDFGTDLTDVEKRWYSPEHFSSSDIPLISSRSYYMLNGIKYPLPSAWKRRLRYELVKSTTYDFSKEKIVSSYRYVPIPLQVAVSDYVRIRFGELARLKLRQGHDVEGPPMDYEDFLSMAIGANSKVESSENSGLAKLRQFYAKSVF